MLKQFITQACWGAVCLSLVPLVAVADNNETIKPNLHFNQQNTVLKPDKKSDKQSHAIPSPTSANIVKPEDAAEAVAAVSEVSDQIAPKVAKPQAHIMIQPPVVVTLGNNETVQLSMSEHQLNRLFVKGDSISNIDCPQSFCEISFDKDDPSGAVKIKYHTNNAFTYHVTTHGGYNFSVNVTPKINASGLGDTVEFVLIGGNPTKKATEEDSPYQKLIIKRMRQMMQNKESDNFSYVAVKPDGDQSANTIYDNLMVRPIKAYQSATLKGVVYQLTNTGKLATPLAESQFYTHGDRAIALDQHSLAPHQSTYLYVLR
ncbi:type-F conjugative transfer system secretin TraK [Fangia hongkongensis]|uniref:type-F conjugative transfer system secretin TraK n=1 Tax=Fangia hongkongensis TaxID=270495 RepID=UPI000375C1AF|nr:type-F conjugative transfer system secretin TraK [Fangia hongkongensis]MBK2123759.1 type-F conjugative transfer system secretin TraK [Fangia hongkongensis]